MCLSKRWITNQYTGQRLFVNCGCCPSCQQEKANRRLAKIKNHIADNDDFHIFLTLTYDNDSVPYITTNSITDDCYVTVKRFSDKRRVYVPKLKQYRIKDYGTEIIGSIDMLSEDERESLDKEHLKRRSKLLKNDFVKTCPPLRRHAVSDAVGITWSRDFYLFIKILRYYLREYYNIELSSYYRVSEYGPTSQRPHFHSLLSFNKNFFSQIPQIRRAVIKSWTFCAPYRFYKRDFELAINPWSYVSSYVNRPSDFPQFLTHKPFLPRASHSKGFGFGLHFFKPDNIISSVNKGLVTYPCTVIGENSVPQQFNLPYPEYVSRRYFPKFKGMFRQSYSEIYNTLVSLSLPNSIYESSGYTPEEYTRFRRTITYARQRLNLSRVDYAMLYIKYYQLRFSYTFYHSFDYYDDLNILEHYDNVDYILYSEYLEDTFPEQSRPPARDVELDPNNYPLNVIKDSRLYERYLANIKQRKLINYE